MKLKFIIACLLLVAVTQLNAENDKWQAGARSAAMGDASLANQDVWAGFNNPAALAGIDGPSLGMFYENRFLVSELSSAALAFCMPLGNSTVALNYSRFGYSAYNENRIGLAYAMPLAGWLSMGVQFDYLNAIQPSSYGNVHVLSFDLGILAEPVEDFFFAAHIFNPVNVDFKGGVNREIPAALRIGMAYQFSGDVLASIETESDMDTYTILKMGLEYRMLDHFIVMAGLNAKPAKASFGAAWEWKDLRLDLAYSYHQQLGSSPHVGINYAF